MNAKKIISGILSAALALSMAACSAAPATTEQPAAQPAQTQTQAAAETPKQEATAPETQPAAQQVESAKAPKYVFLFIGDGMSYPQFQAASDYLGALADSDYTQALPSNSYDDRAGAVLDGPEALNFMNFDVAGSAVTYDSCSFAPDSASTATSIATGYKTYSGMINVDITGSTPYETIAEKLHSQKGWKVGIISSVNLNHATPAAFYAHQASRNNYYEIGEELVASGFEYFAGGGLKKVTGPDKDKTSLYDLAADAGYKVTYTQADAEAVTAADEKVILIDEHLADSDAMDYEMDRQDGEWALADYVEKGIEVLDNDTGFFMMCEGGKIDWACHANDAGATVTDTLALADAVQVAIDFAKEHADETLILVTGDHETGGLTIGFAGTDYDTYLDSLANQTISYAQFDEQYVAAYNTMLTANGANLSQGQRQLLSIARAAVADPPVMILDEATSSIDTRTEALVQRGMDALMKGRTVFVNSHRLSTVQNSDAIMVLDHGRIIERGTHDDLIAKKGTYYQLYTGAFELE